jgi:hypothetical protein
MNGSQPYMDSHSQQHMSASQPYAPYPAPSSHYQAYQQPPPGPSHSHYQPPQYQTGGYGYPNGVPQSPQSVGHHSSAPQVPSQAIQLPGMHTPLMKVSSLTSGSNAYANSKSRAQLCSCKPATVGRVSTTTAATSDGHHWPDRSTRYQAESDCNSLGRRGQPVLPS